MCGDRSGAGGQGVRSGIEPDGDLRGQGAEPCILGKKNRKGKIGYDRQLNGERNVLERFFARTRQY